jgi:hypothetical protein
MEEEICKALPTLLKEAERITIPAVLKIEAHFAHLSSI